MGEAKRKQDKRVGDKSIALGMLVAATGIIQNLVSQKYFTGENLQKVTQAFMLLHEVGESILGGKE